MATRAGRKDRWDPCKCLKGGGVYAPFLSILAHNIRVTGSDAESAPPTFIVRTLIERGAIAYVRSANVWAGFVSVGRLRRTGFPRRVRLVGDNGLLSGELFVEEDKDADVCIIPANAYMFPPRASIEEKVDSLRVTANAIGQNLDALRACMLIMYNDKNLAAQIEEAERKRLSGARTVSICKAIGQDVETSVFTPEADSHITELLALWGNTIEELDELTGRVKIGDKTERRTDDEIDVIRKSAFTSVDMLIDTPNEFAKWYGLDVRFAEASSEPVDGREPEDGGVAEPEGNEAQGANDETEEGEEDNA